MNFSAEDLRKLTAMVGNLDKMGAAFDGAVRHVTEAGQGVTLTVRWDSNSGKHYLALPDSPRQ